jgi:ubiquinone/menaquinone biosynthesis C-methylase UbiE
MIEMLFSSDPKGRLNTYPFTEKEKRYCRIQEQEILKYIVRCNANSLPFAQSSFDLVFCIDSLHHLNPKKVLKEFRRVLKPKGKLILVEKNYLNPITWVGDIIFNLVYEIKEKTLTKWQISSCLKEAGFKNIKSRFIKTSRLPISCPILYLSSGD